MVEAKASDLHLSTGMPPLVRKDGTMQPLEPGVSAMTAADVDGAARARSRRRRTAPSSNGATTRISRTRSRAWRAFAPTSSWIARAWAPCSASSRAKILTAEQLGLSPQILQLCKLSKGLVLVTGPTGSGKSTTLCAMIDYINKNRNDHIITIEDPIEFVHENKQCLINQREVDTHTDGFKDALRAALREDPDIVLVGEMRDLETVAIAIETAETGHLVFGTLHTTHGGLDGRSHHRSVPGRTAGADPRHALRIAQGRDCAERCAARSAAVASPRSRC